VPGGTAGGVCGSNPSFPEKRTPAFAAFFYTPLKASPLLCYTIGAMTQENINNLENAYDYNLASLNTRGDDFGRERRLSVAFLATIIDYLRGEIKGLPSPLSELARNNADSSYPSPPQDNGDPNPEDTETLKHLGSLGIQSLDELTGYKYDEAGHILLRIKGRFADSGWMEDDPRISRLINIMETFKLPFPLVP